MSVREFCVGHGMICESLPEVSYLQTVEKFVKAPQDAANTMLEMAVGNPTLLK